MRRKKIFFYIVREILAPLGMGLVVFTFILLIGRIFKLSDLVINKGVNLFDVLKLFVCMRLDIAESLGGVGGSEPKTVRNRLGN